MCVVSSEIKAYNGIASVITLVKTEQATAVECAITVLVNMAQDEQLAVDLVDSDIIPALIHALSFQLVLSHTYIHTYLFAQQISRT